MKHIVFMIGYKHIQFGRTAAASLFKHPTPSHEIVNPNNGKTSQAEISTYGVQLFTVCDTEVTREVITN